MKLILNFSIFRTNPNFRYLFMGQFVSFLGTMITGVALPYQIYIETHSTLMVGLLSLFQLLPLLVTALIGGVMADRYHRRMLLLISESVLTVGSLLLALNAFTHTPSIGLLFLISACMSGFNGLHRPALESMIQQIVSKEEYATVGSLVSFKGSFCMVAGPAIGGLLIASVGIGATYLVDFASFLFSLFSILMMSNIPKPPKREEDDDSTWAALKAGFRYASSRQELLGTYFVDFIAMVFGMPTALFPAIAMSFGGAKVVGMLYSAPAVGALVISFFSAWTNDVKRHGRAIALAAIFWGISIIAFGFATQLIWALFFLAVAGAFDAISGIFRITMWNQTIPAHLRGRLAGIEMISYLSGPRLGDTEAGLVAAAFGITASVVSGGILCVLGVGVCCYFLPKFWRYRAE